MQAPRDDPSLSALANASAHSAGPAHPLDITGSSFQSEYDRELGKLLRRRLGWLCLAFALWEVIAVGGMVARELVPPMVESYFAPDAVPPPVLLEAAEPEELLLLTPVEESTKTDSFVDSDLTPSERARARRDEQSRPWGAAERATSRELGFALGAFVDGLKNGFDGGTPAREPRKTSREEQPSAKRRADALDNPSPTPQDRRANRTASIKQAPPSAAANASGSLPLWAGLVSASPVFAILAWFGLIKRPRLTTRRNALRAATKMILWLGATKLAFESGALLMDRDAWVFPLLTICFWHFSACLFLPWSPRESLRPIWPLFFAWIAVRTAIATVEGGWIGVGVNVVFAPILFSPGLLVCYYRLRWHENEFKAGFAGDRFRLLRQELGHARKLHETLFPKPFDDACVRFDFVYRPAAQIGGDFVHCETDSAGRTTVLLIDVVGHGIASALTVARVQGELERLLSEHPDDGPGALLHRLNHYFRRLLSKHRLFATAIAVRLDPQTGELRWANAGHPPALVRSSRKTTPLDSTTFLLGAVDGDAFGSVEESVTLIPGESVILYTDGLIEAASLNGDRFGIDRLQSTLARAHPGGRWVQALSQLVFTHASGEQQDDILIVELFYRAAQTASMQATDLAYETTASAVQ